MYFYRYGSLTPADEIDQENCEKCKEPFLELANWDGRDSYFCEACFDELAAEWEAHAIEFAREHCRITRRLKPHYTDLEWTLTPDEYALGRESPTPKMRTVAHAATITQTTMN